ncbi:alkyldihydroxyacetonephosphate synthase [Blastococcus colisei]|uniref:Alkyldihydroxyacetonephosphate synthase n=1 Tax=Blastococcus colisei TaxID=1564162 RepID=A0A543P9K3_9ACTN|nr:FAD-binding oxidoreductase [Blastococcus colisei]TQN40759.1 alkyldihydroxyacetonephosphate synthase [Blastococcus colisei]
MTPERSWWGWGTTDRALSDDECVALGGLVPGLPDRPRAVPRVEDVTLPVSRLAPPSSLPVTTDPAVRASHTYGKAYRDVVRALSGDLPGAPDAVACPVTEDDVVRLLDWAGSAGVVVVPFGGGSSVVGGVEYRGDRAWLSMDLTALDRVLEVDPVSRAARIQAGALGPVLEEQVRPHGLTLRHFPQSFEFSTLGGWLATRAGGHFATLHTHIDDLVESMRFVTPAGVSESWRLPGSGAGPSPDRLFLGSEGTLGVVTEAWMRLQDRPRFKASTSVTFRDMTTATAAVREIAQAGLYPANCRLLDPGEAALSGASSSGECVLVLGVESAVHPVEGRLAELTDLAHAHGGAVAARAGARDGAAEAWRSAFLRMPYVRDGMARMSAIVETFETACTWDRVEEVYATVQAEIGAAVQEVTGAPGLVNCRFTHVYPDGAAPYLTVIAAGRLGSEVAMWDDVKTAAMEVLGRLGATVTHHHAIGRDHRPGYDRQRPEPFAVALRSVKAALDPAGILNPGVLIDPV